MSAQPPPTGLQSTVRGTAPAGARGGRRGRRATSPSSAASVRPSSAAPAWTTRCWPSNTSVVGTRCCPRASENRNASSVYSGVREAARARERGGLRRRLADRDADDRDTTRGERAGQPLEGRELAHAGLTPGRPEADDRRARAEQGGERPPVPAAPGQRNLPEVRRRGRRRRRRGPRARARAPRSRPPLVARHSEHDWFDPRASDPGLRASGPDPEPEARGLRSEAQGAPTDQNLWGEALEDDADGACEDVGLQVVRPPSSIRTPRRGAAPGGAGSPSPPRRPSAR